MTEMPLILKRQVGIGFFQWTRSAPCKKSSNPSVDVPEEVRPSLETENILRLFMKAQALPAALRISRGLNKSVAWGLLPRTK